ncbi:MAG: DUF480 domain-containing protein [Planctomycetota bacterium]|nr:DUF480 domain-containing protein [Planctomycetota bacterium]MDA1210934.1 DUF480 domain-containing protein [Planctomycetota bacterium]
MNEHALPEMDAKTQISITHLTKAQRRVLGVLVEKGITTPEYYPLTLKAVTAGCNQKNNRDPIASYTEDAVEETLDQLRELGLVAVVHTETGRTQRFRHYMRHRFTMSEPQLALLTELLLRGKQQLGELRSRASRMAPIESLEQLRTELKGLIEMNFAQADGPLERRGILVDHNWYTEKEGQRLEYRQEFDDSSTSSFDEGDLARTSSRQTMIDDDPVSQSTNGSSSPARYDDLNALCQKLSDQNRSLESDIETLRTQMNELADIVHDLRRQLGG